MVAHLSAHRLFGQKGMNYLSPSDPSNVLLNSFVLTKFGIDSLGFVPTCDFLTQSIPVTSSASVSYSQFLSHGHKFV